MAIKIFQEIVLDQHNHNESHVQTDNLQKNVNSFEKTHLVFATQSYVTSMKHGVLYTVFVFHRGPRKEKEVLASE